MESSAAAQHRKQGPTNMSGKVNMDTQSKEPDGTPADPSASSASETILISDSVAKKARAQPHTTTALLLQAPPCHQKVELTQALAVANPGKGSRPNEIAAPTLTAQVGGACSIVHVLEWKEGMAILPSSNLKFCVSDVGTLSTLITPGTTGGTTGGPTDPAAGTSGRSIEAESAPDKPGTVIAPRI
ncbi:hypothetical protein AMECASPLE_009435 [Ameca splendens]|uniref:Uncharacterized protein n=1 Tax=Ameca splendens TaxID=208324 RepID=A0ABV0Z918_9TELE